MACTRPINGYRTPQGTVTTKAGEGFFNPLRPLTIACGQCEGCRIQRKLDWSVRIMHEVQIEHELTGRDSSFITLTYNKRWIPTDYGLQKGDWQRFARKLRKKFGAFRYFHSGEYGETNLRPHYHAILFGIDFYADRIPIGTNANGDRIYHSPTLQRIWGRGDTQLGSVTQASAAYVAKYTVKKATNERIAELYTRRKDGHEWEVQPEYATMSLKPGIGERWWRKYAATDINPTDSTLLNGKEVKTPRYYDKLQERHDLVRRELARIRRSRNALLNRADNTPERLLVKEELARLNALAKRKTGL